MIPRFFLLDLIEVRFNRKLSEDLSENKLAAMQARFESIDVVKLQSFLPSDEVGNWQAEIIKGGLLTTFEKPNDMQLLWGRLSCFWGAVPRDMQTATTFTLTDAIKEHLVNMRVAFDKEIHISDPTLANNKVLAIAHSQQEICKIFTAMGTEMKFLKVVKEHLDKGCKHQADVRRLSVMATQCNTFEMVVQMDTLMHDLGDAVPAEIRVKHGLGVEEMLKALAGRVSSIIARALGDANSLQFEKYVPVDFALLSIEVKGFMDLKIMELPECKVHKELCVLLRALCAAPFQLLHKRDDCEDIGVFEDLGQHLALGAQALAAGSLVVAAFSVGSEHSMGLDFELLRAVQDKGFEVLAAQEKKCIEPKFGVVLPVIYADKAYWDKLSAAGTSASFVGEGEIEATCEHAQSVKGIVASASTSLDEAVTLLLALGKADEATVLQVQFRLARLRYAYAEVKKEVANFATEFTALSSSQAAGVMLLASRLDHLMTGMSGSAWEASFTAFQAARCANPKGDGIVVVPAANMQAELDFACTASRELLDGVISKVSARMLMMANALENKVPKYAEFTVTTFNGDRVQEELIKKSWDCFATEWVALSKLASNTTGMNNSITGDFEKSNSATWAVVTRALVAGKTFISTISTVTTILVTLPASPRADRADIIWGHVQKVKMQKCRMHENLRDYLIREYTKAGGKKPLPF